MENGWYVTAQDIDHWTKTNQRKAQETLPLLIRKLIVASVNSKRVSIPYGNNITQKGWDGVLNVEHGNTYVPKGMSVWEFGTNEEIKKKANEDYNKRTNNPFGFDKKKTTFVFVTSRIWQNDKRDEWENEKKQQNKWLQIRALHAVDLEAWLHECPAVHRWFARVIGKRTDNVWDIEQAWKGWSCATRPACNEELVIAGRLKQAEDLIELLESPPSVINIKGESEDEAYAFSLAVIKSSEKFSDRLLVIKESSDWDRIIDSKQQLILIPKFVNRYNIGLAIQYGHWVIKPLGSSESNVPKPLIELGKANKEHLHKALVNMGLSEERAKEVVISCRGYLQPIRRHPSLSPVEYSQPMWIIDKKYEPALIALLAGAWNDKNEKDRQKVSELACVPYEEFEKQLHELSIKDDPPVRKVGDVWQCVSRQDLWNLLAKYIYKDLLQRFIRIAEEVLAPTENQAKDKFIEYSSYLRYGLSEMITMLACYDDNCKSIGSYEVRDEINILVRNILTKNISVERWRYLKNILPLLAEASPEVLLDEINNRLYGDKPALKDLLEETYVEPFLHEILWALECISWNLDYLVLVVRTLAKLDKIYPRSIYVNSPLNSLKSIFLGWYPQTKAPLNQRIAIIDYLLKYEQYSAWKLLLLLLPYKTGESSTPIYRPKFRQWDEGWLEGVTDIELNEHILSISERIVKNVDKDPSRWKQVIERLSDLHYKYLNDFIDKLSLINSNDLPQEVLKEIRDELRNVIGRHREFPNTKWALPEDYLKKLEKIYINLTPRNLVEKYLYLFDDHYPVLINPVPRVEGDGRKKNLELLDQLRIKAVEEIWDLEKEKGIECLAIQSKYPNIVGNILGISSISKDVEPLILRWLEIENKAMEISAKAYVSERYKRDHEWINSVIMGYKDKWSVETWAKFCLGLPFCGETFSLLEKLGDNVSRYYWSKIESFYLSNEDSKYAAWVIKKLLESNRPIPAISAAHHYLFTHKSKAGIDNNLLAIILERAADKLESTNDFFRYEIGEIIKILQHEKELPEDRLTQIEWAYLSIFDEFNDIKPRSIIRRIVNDPSYFVQLICLCYPPDPNIDDEYERYLRKLSKQNTISIKKIMGMIDVLPG